MEKNLVEIVRQTGFPYTDRLIHLFVGGSELHGAKVQGTDDMDIYGLFIEPAPLVIGLDKFEHFVWSTSKDSERNGPDDIDVTLYSLRKWVGMAAKGNPTALHFLFALNRMMDSDSEAAIFWGEACHRLKKLVLTKQASKQFMGFVDAQMGRLLGTRGRGKKGQRPEIEAKFGYDVKAGMHAVRLLHECIELMRRHEITLPRPEKEELTAIRTGGWSLDRLSSYVNGLFVVLKEERDRSTLPEEPDRLAISDLVTRIYMNYWRKDKFC